MFIVPIIINDNDYYSIGWTLLDAIAFAYFSSQSIYLVFLDIKRCYLLFQCVYVVVLRCTTHTFAAKMPEHHLTNAHARTHSASLFLSFFLSHTSRTHTHRDRHRIFFHFVRVCHTHWIWIKLCVCVLCRAVLCRIHEWVLRVSECIVQRYLMLCDTQRASTTS